MQSPASAPAVQQTPEDETDIDVRKYISIVARRWHLLLTCTIVGALLGGLLGVLAPAPFEATSTVAIVKTSTQVEFDPRFKTITQDEIAAVNADSRRATLLGLVENGAIASTVVKELDAQLTQAERNPVELMSKVDAAAAGRGDLILIKVRDQNPDKAADIANAWAREYERYVNDLYAGAPANYEASVEEQYNRARAEADASQTALEEFIAASDIDQLERTISETRQLLDTLQLGKQNALTLVISEQLKANSAIIAAYLGSQSANRLVAFEKEQEGRRGLIAAYLATQNDAQIQVFQQRVQSDLDALKTGYSTQLRVRQLIGDATAMRDQVRAGGDAAATSNSVALSLLKSQVFALGIPVTANLQIQLQAQTTPATAAEQVRDLDALISALERRDQALTNEIEEISARMLSGEGYNLHTSDANGSRITKAISDTYPLLFDVGPIGRLSEAVPVSNPLTLAAQDRAEEILRFRSSNLPTSALANTSDDEAIASLQRRLQESRARLEQQQATLDRLLRERDLRRETRDTLASKRTEVTLANAVTGSEVRLAAPALPPERRVIGRLPIVAIGALGGLLVGIVLAFILHAFFDGAIARLPRSRSRFHRAAYWVLAAH
jgi:capsular polysaccharide biosynthesis protein